MAKRSERCFIHDPDGPKIPVEKIKFAVVDDEGCSRSAIWTVFPAHNSAKIDVYATASGLEKTLKFSFHGDILNHSFYPGSREKLVSEGIVPPGSRHQIQIPIPPLPWFGLKLRIAQCVLRKIGHEMGHIKGTIIALPAPKEGTILEVGFLLARGSAINIRDVDFCFGEIATGGRNLLLVCRYRQHEAIEFKNELRKQIESTPIAFATVKKMAEGDWISAHMVGEDDGCIVVTEVHNVRLKTDAERRPPLPD